MDSPYSVNLTHYADSRRERREQQLAADVEVKGYAAALANIAASLEALADAQADHVGWLALEDLRTISASTGRLARKLQRLRIVSEPPVR